MKSPEQPLYQKIYDSLEKGIKSGEYLPGARLPSEKELSQQFGVSRITSIRALEMLAMAGSVVRLRGKGTFVAGTEGITSGKASRTGVDRGAALIGVVIPDFSDSYGRMLIAGIESSCSEKGLFVIIKRSNGIQELEARAVESLVQLGVGGIIILPVHGEHYNPGVLHFVLAGYPIVFVDRRMKGIPSPFVGTNNLVAAKKASDYLLDQGHSMISLVSPPVANTSTLEDRIERGFVRSHAERGVSIEEDLWLTTLTSTMPGQETQEHIAEDIVRIRDLVKKKPVITCFFAMEYNIALIIREALGQLGKSVPKDISILCFDSPPNYVGMHEFTHMQQRENEIGIKAVQFLLRQIEGKAVSEEIMLDADLVIGSSTKALADSI